MNFEAVKTPLFKLLGILLKEQRLIHIEIQMYLNDLKSEQ